MRNDLASLRAQLRGLTDISGWIAFLADPARSKARFEELAKSTAAAAASQEKLEQQQAALDRRAEDIEARDKKVREGELELFQARRVDEARREAEREEAQDWPNYEERLRHFMMRMLGRDQNPLQDKPSLEQLWSELNGGRRADAHFTEV